MLIDIKMKKNSVAELGHNCHLKIYVDPKKNYINTGIYISPKWLGVFG